MDKVHSYTLAMDLAKTLLTQTRDGVRRWERTISNLITSRCGNIGWYYLEARESDVPKDERRSSDARVSTHIRLGFYPGINPGGPTILLGTRHTEGETKPTALAELYFLASGGASSTEQSKMAILDAIYQAPLGDVHQA